MDLTVKTPMITSREQSDWEKLFASSKLRTYLRVKKFLLIKTMGINLAYNSFL